MLKKSSKSTTSPLRGRWSIFGFLLTKIARKSDSTQKFLLFDCKVMRLKNPVVTMRKIFFWKNFSKIRVEVGASLDQKITKSLFIFFWSNSLYGYIRPFRIQWSYINYKFYEGCLSDSSKSMMARTARESKNPYFWSFLTEIFPKSAETRNF